MAPRVLVLTPIKNAADCLDSYFAGLERLDWPRDRLSLGLLESDSADGTYERFAAGIESRRDRLAARIWKKDFGFRIPAGKERWDPALQPRRRSVLARSRNHLLFRALRDEDWVLWLDVDVIDYPRDLLQRLLAAGKDIVHPHCVKAYGGPTFDLNAWRDHGRLHMADLRAEGELVELDAVGGSVLLVRADVHREGLVFPAFHLGRRIPRARRDHRGRAWFDLLRAWRGDCRGEIETEGLGIMAHEMGYRCWGMPRLEVLHRDA